MIPPVRPVDAAHDIGDQRPWHSGFGELEYDAAWIMDEPRQLGRR